MKKPRNNAYALIAILSLASSGCATKMAGLPQGERVLYSADGTNKIPEWVYLRPYEEIAGRIFVSGVVDITGNQSPSRGLAAADLQARAELAKQIRTRLSNQLQYANEGFGYDNQVLEGIITQGSEVVHMSDVRIVDRGYAQIATTNLPGASIKYTCFSRASVDAANLKQMIERSLAEAEGQGRISESFRKKVDGEWNRFFGTPSQPN